jgi:hypothetical protein
MADFNVIADASKTLQEFLRAALLPLDPNFLVDVSDLQGNIATAPLHLTLFLYEIVEDPSARNRPHVREVVPPDVRIRKPPAALMLRYMMTPWSGDRLTDHKIMGRVVQTLYDHAIIAGPDLQGGLAGTDAALKITMAPISLEDRARVWFSVQKPYRLSINYEVRVVNVDSELERGAGQVRSRTIVPHQPEPEEEP